MQTPNLLKLNDWEIKAFLKVIFSIQIAVFIVIALGVIGYDLPIVRPLVCFVYLTFIPGIVALRVLRLHDLNIIDGCIYAVALSMAVLMLTGLLADLILPQFGLSQPMSLLPLLTILSGFVIVCSLFSYMTDKGFSGSAPTNIKLVASPPTLFLLLIPFLAIFGTYLVNYYQNSFFLMCMILLIGIVVVLVGFDKLPKRLYPLAIIVIALSLFYQNSLISEYVVRRADMGPEFMVSNIVLQNSYWNLTVGDLYNSALSLTILAPVYSIIAHIDLTWVFKIIYPFLYSIVPLCIFRLAQKQIGDKAAFLSSFFFVSMYIYFTLMVGLNRSIVAEIFLLSFVLVLVDSKMNKRKSSILLITFALSLAFSHYSIAYIFIYMLIFLWLGLALIYAREIRKRRRIRHLGIASSTSSKSRNNEASARAEWSGLTVIVILSGIFILAWSIFTAGASSFEGVTSIVSSIPQNLATEFLQSSPGSSADVLTKTPSTLLFAIYKDLLLITVLFILIGLFVAIFQRKRRAGFATKYVIVSFSFIPLLIAAVVLPAVSYAISPERLYHLALALLAPFSVFGGMVLLESVAGICKKIFPLFGRIVSAKKIQCLSIFFVVYLLFNTGFVFQIAGSPIYETLSPGHIDPQYEIQKFTRTDVVAAAWLNTNKDVSDYVYSAGRYDMLGDFFSGPFSVFAGQNDVGTKVPGTTYIFLGYTNVKTGTIRLAVPETIRGESYQTNVVQINDTKLNKELINGQKIYDNGNAQIFRSAFTFETV